MTEWFRSLQPREQIVLGVGGIVVVVILFWALIWQPIVSGTAELRDDVADKERLLGDLQRSSVTDMPAQPNTPDAAQSLVLLISQTSEARGLSGSITRYRPDGSNAINVSIQNAAFDNLLGWLVSLQQDFGVAVESASINGTTETGRVSGQIFLRRG